MSNRRSITDFPRNEAGLVDEFLGTAYDVVKQVYDNLDEVLSVGNQITELDSLAETAVETAMIPAREEISVGVATSAESATKAEDAAQRARSINVQFPFSFVEGQGQYDVTIISGDPEMTTTGMALWVEGALEYAFTVDSDRLFTLNDPSIYANGAQMRVIINSHFDDVVHNLDGRDDIGVSFPFPELVEIPTGVFSGVLSIPHMRSTLPPLQSCRLTLVFPGTIPDTTVMVGVVGITPLYVDVAYRWSNLPTTGLASIQLTF